MSRTEPPEIWISANTTWNLINFRKRLMQVLLDAGYRVTAFAPADSYVDAVRALGVRHVHFELDNRSTNPLREAMTILRVARHLRRHRPSLLLTFTPKANIYGSIAARWAGVPVIANVAGLGRAFADEGWLSRVSRALYRVALRHPRTVFFQNREDLESFVAAGIANESRSALLPGSGVDVTRFSPVQPASKQRFVFLLAGRLLAEKGVREYADAARQLLKAGVLVECRIVGFVEQGDARSVQESELAAWEHEGIVRYLGVSDDIAAIMAEADCVVLPSYYKEGVPRVLLEAASMGLPLIAADSSGCRDVVVDGVNGFLCRPRDARDLAEKMQNMATTSLPARAAMGRAGRERIVSEYDERTVVERYMHAIRPLLSRIQPPEHM